MKAYYRPDEVADLFGVTRRTIYRLIKKRKLSAIKIGASLRQISKSSKRTRNSVTICDCISPR